MAEPMGCWRIEGERESYTGTIHVGGLVRSEPCDLCLPSLNQLVVKSRDHGIVECWRRLSPLKM